MTEPTKKKPERKWLFLIVGLAAAGACIPCSGVGLAIGLTGMAGSSEGGGNAMAYKSARTKAIWAGIALACLAALAVIVGGILALAG